MKIGLVTAVFFLLSPGFVSAEELAYDSGQLRGYLSNMLAGQAEAMRLTAQHPARVQTVRLRFSKPGQVEIHVWKDNGGHQADFAQDLILPVTLEAPQDGWLEFDLSEAIEICAECHFHVGHVLLVDDGPVLAVDDSQAAEVRAMMWGYSSDLGQNVWFSIGEEVSGQMIYRNYMVRAEVEYHDRIINKTFTDVTELTGFGRPRRIAAVDFDLDGDIDVLQGGKLLRNEGGQFVDVSEAVGLSGFPSVVGGVFADYDRDGDLDLFLFVNSCCSEAEAAGVYDRLLRNDQGVFTDVTDTAGTLDYYPNESASWGDFNSDGYPDLFLPGYSRTGAMSTPTGYTLFINDQDGTFSRSPNPGMIGLEPAKVSRTVPWADYDQDGLLDLYVGAYRLQQNYLYRNLGGSFEEVGQVTNTAGIETSGSYGHSIGAEWGDLDNDGDLDLVVMNLAHPRFLSFSDLSKIYLNPYGTGSTNFIDVRQEVGVAYKETASEPALGDFDNDGDLDLFQTNVYVGRESNFYANRFVEEGSLRFEEISYSSGARVDNGWGAVWADYDGDGDLDLLAQGLYRNDGPVGNWLKVRLKGGDGQDTFGIGATVSVTAGDLSVTRLVSAGKGVGNQNPFELHFGLGDSEMYDSIHVNWLGGQVDQHPRGLVNQRLVLSHGEILDPPDGGQPEITSEGGCGCASTKSGYSLLAVLGILFCLVGIRRR
ncbi:MAG: CRTAC1 family protein [Deltaproteobacteria bacterium]|nr:CRTAC1 family protein [Deltaproteobacteria bacterium]